MTSLLKSDTEGEKVPQAGCQTKNQFMEMKVLPLQDHQELGGEVPRTPGRDQHSLLENQYARFENFRLTAFPPSLGTVLLQARLAAYIGAGIQRRVWSRGVNY